MKTMKKTLIAASILLPLSAASSVAFAQSNPQGKLVGSHCQVIDQNNHKVAICDEVSQRPALKEVKPIHVQQMKHDSHFKHQPAPQFKESNHKNLNYKGHQHQVKKERAQRVDLSIFRGIDLTQSQKNEMRSVLQQARHAKQATHQLHRAEMQKYREDLQKLVLNDNFDTAAVKALAQKYTQVRNDNKEQSKVNAMVERAQVQNKLYNLLTQEQKTQLKKNIEQRQVQRTHDLQQQIKVLQAQLDSIK